MDLYFAISKMTKYFSNCSYPFAVIWVCILNDFFGSTNEIHPIVDDD